MIILGIDPGTTRVGYGVIEKNKGVRLIESGLIGDEKADRYDRLTVISSGIERVIKKHKPDVVSIEEVFFSNNRKTVMSVSEARGVILHCCHKEGIPILEYSPSDIKAAICGNGAANKEDIKRAVVMTLGDIEVTGPDDEWDAIAIAIRGSFDPLNRAFKKPLT
ncbi:MAG: crossover junction endodeoxyribonuclease RuvC [Candidatus Colwellbacteria bacterium CG10_big_fil_rev_8_21_14_0_10_41_28]|uniref:Crossover junction endodeoxyribonuclease RuvC n=1 Tax=Candidatus Colwellbacteria bacterium CG10_big_fil_rev_8_21_14_0_10_41_28 TaxID=1974539 RepID=A0A2H0VJV5_9BACT|nr:MAG: crossover junction endodeoxyribonuclease RuvC [Candidatus Colwellbacteria bacterium CG10_big_fil_rev_8_21_14_0_10_41_28]